LFAGEEMPVPGSGSDARPRGAGTASSREDRARAERYLRGDTATFRELDAWIRGAFRGRYPGLAREHEDLAQAVHAKLFASLKEDRYKPDRGLRAYVSGIVHHAAIDRLREIYRTRMLSETLIRESTPAPQPDPYSEALDEGDLLPQALLAVPRSCRGLWRLMFVEKLTYEEIGERLSIPTGTVKSRMWHCRRKALAALRRLRLVHQSASKRAPGRRGT
jgi:RNA polymerase sigma-70 factor (ECF subfamily)